MLALEALEIISNGKNSGVEFKNDDIRPEQLAKELVAFANLQGGKIFLGVEDNGEISGIKRNNLEQWVLNCFRDKVFPHIIPFYEELIIDDKTIAVVTITAGISKPYVVKHNNRADIYIRMGSRSEIVPYEQHVSLFSSLSVLHTELLPVSGSSLDSLDLSRLSFYLKEIIKDVENVPQTDNEWMTRLTGLGLMCDDNVGKKVCTIAGLVCFGKSPRRYLKQCGLRFRAYRDDEKEYDALTDIVIDGPLVARREMQNGNITTVDGGLLEKFSAAIKPFIYKESSIVDTNLKREGSWLYPIEVIREVVVNALAHRDWTQVNEVEIAIYKDRLEVVSPGVMYNSMTIEKMLAGQRSPRNPLIMEILRDYGYVDSRGMGVRTKVVPLMKKHNNTIPIFDLTEDYLKTILPLK